jgi:hypothetical protein
MRLRGLKYALGAGGMLVLVTAILLATGWGSAVAAQITTVFVTNDASHPVPVSVNNTTVPVHEQGTANTREQNTDANGNIKVHEQGTVKSGDVTQVLFNETIDAPGALPAPAKRVVDVSGFSTIRISAHVKCVGAVSGSYLNFAPGTSTTLPTKAPGGALATAFFEADCPDIDVGASSQNRIVNETIDVPGVSLVIETAKGCNQFFGCPGTVTAEITIFGRP